MPKFSAVSQARLHTCDPRLQLLLNTVIKTVDFAVLCGHRNEADQNKAFAEGKTTKEWPMSKHNRFPSLAVDIAPSPIDWKDTARFARLFGYIERVAEELGIKVRWGGDWNGNYRTADEKLVDMPHIELEV